MKNFLALVSIILLTGCFGSPNEIRAREGSLPFTIPGTFETAACLPLADSFNSSLPTPATFTPVGTTLAVSQAKITAATLAIFNRLISSDFQNAIRITMALAVAFYGLGILLGVAKLSMYEVISRFFKIAIILALVSSWSFFSDNVVNFFNKITESLIGIFTEVFVPASTKVKGITTTDSVGYTFAVIDRIIYSLISLRFWRVFLALIFTGPQGFVYAVFLLAVTIVYLMAVFRAVYMYIVALIAKALLFAMAPLFLTFMLFKQTDSLFQNWLKQIVNFTLQPILIFAFVGFFSGLIFTTMAAGLDPSGTYLVCYTSAEKMPFWQTMLTLTSVLFIPLFLTTVYPIIKSAGVASCKGSGYLFPVCWGINLLLLNKITLSAMLVTLFYALGLLMDSMGIFNVVVHWWRFLKIIPTVPPTAGPPGGLSVVPIDFGLFAVTFILAYLMWRMGDWARDTATALSGGIVKIKGDIGGPMSTMATGVVGTAGMASRLTGTVAGRLFRPRATSSTTTDAASGPTIRRSTGADLSSGTPRPPGDSETP